MASILIVEDEVSILKTIEKIVSGLGHSFRSARNGNQAVPLLKKHAFDLVVTDLFMTSGTGFELVAWLGAEMPKLPVIVCSSFASYAGPDAVKALSRSERMDVVKKPFRGEDLGGAITRMLGRKDSGRPAK